MNNNWVNDDAKRADFWRKASKMGFDHAATHRLLKVESLKDFGAAMGTALSTLQNAATQQRQTTLQVEVLEPDAVRALYPTDELHALGLAVRSFAPWANGKYRMTDTEIALTVRRGESLGLDVFNQHEIQVWKDKRGTVNFQIAYTLLAQWVNEVHGGHTEPRYTRLVEEELIAQGLALTDIAYRCTFVMKTDIPLIATMVQAGWDPVQAREDLTVCGIGTASLAQWNDHYFAPNARSKVWKVQKRAYTDAVRLRFGTPSRPAIERMRRSRGEEHVTPADWQIAAGENNEGRVRLAAMSAQARTQVPDVRTPEEILAENGHLLHGDQQEI